MIQTLQPPLNFPFIARWFCPKKGIIRPPSASLAKQIGYQRILRKRRSKLMLAQSSRGLPLPLNAIFDTPTFRTREATWVLLTKLGSNTTVNFEACKRLRSSEFTHPALCALHRMAKHLPAYMAPQAVRHISLALEFKGFGGPRFYRPLRAPFLAHETYRRELSTCVRAHITQNIKAVTPFHVPKTSVLFAKHPSVSQLLFNHKDALRAWAARHPPVCCWDKLRQWAPDAPVFQGHIAATAEDFTTSAFSTVEKDILNGSMANTFFPKPEQLFEQFNQAWVRWCRANDSPGPPEGIREVFNNLHTKHHQAAQGRYRAEAVRSIRTKKNGAIWHCEDHRARQAVCYCPCLYYQALSGTFENPAIFNEPGTSFDQQLRQVQKLAKVALGRRYPWAFWRQTRTPVAYILPKRPIVSFVDAFLRPLLEATARLLHRLIALAFPHSFAKGEQDFLKNSSDEAMHCRNQSLSGFFTSISTTQFQHAWTVTREFYRQRHGVELDTVYTVNLKEQ